MATDWNNRSAVERDPETLGCSLVFRNARIPVAAHFENQKRGATVEQFLESYPRMTFKQVEAVIDHETHEMQATVA